MKASPNQSNFNGGELSPLLYGRPEWDRYKVSYRRGLNVIALVQGGLIKRAGTVYVDTRAPGEEYYAEFVPFEFSTEQSYALLFGDRAITVYKDRGIVETSPGVKLNIQSPYTAAHLRAAPLCYVQQADVLYLFHPLVRPKKLSRSSHTTWRIEDVVFRDGPYMAQPPAALNSVDPNTGVSQANSVSFTARAGTMTGRFLFTAGINDNAGLSQGDVGRHIRVRYGDQWIWGYISRVTSPVDFGFVVPDSQIMPADPNNATRPPPSTNWILGAFSDTTGWPSVGCFYQDRLVTAGLKLNPGRVDLSMSGKYETFSPTALGTGVVAGDNGRTYVINSPQLNTVQWMRGTKQGLAIGITDGEWILDLGKGPTDMPSAYQHDFAGSARVLPISLGSATIFAQRNGTRMYEFAFKYEKDRFVASDISLYSEHLFSKKVQQLALQRGAPTLLWARMEDGSLVSTTYNDEHQVVGSHHHQIAGFTNATWGKVKSMTAIVSGKETELWLLVRRYRPDGSVVNTVEYMAPLTEASVSDEVHADCALRSTSLSSTALFTGADHLSNQVVSLWADGKKQPNATVSYNGRIVLTDTAKQLIAGLPFAAEVDLLRQEAGSADGTAQAKTKRIHRCAFRLHRTSPGAKFGRDMQNLYEADYGEAIFSGDFSTDWDGDYDFDAYVTAVHDAPGPFCLLSVMPQLYTQDR